MLCKRDRRNQFGRRPAQPVTGATAFPPFSFPLSTAMLILTFFCVYLLVGGVFGVGFFVRGYAAIGPAARGASIPVRLLWTPAAVALWPWLTVKWWRARTADGETKTAAAPSPAQK